MELTMFGTLPLEQHKEKESTKKKKKKNVRWVNQLCSAIEGEGLPTDFVGVAGCAYRTDSLLTEKERELLNPRVREALQCFPDEGVLVQRLHFETPQFDPYDLRVGLFTAHVLFGVGFVPPVMPESTGDRPLQTPTEHNGLDASALSEACPKSDHLAIYECPVSACTYVNMLAVEHHMTDDDDASTRASIVFATNHIGKYVRPERGRQVSLLPPLL